MGDASEGQIRRTARRLEQFRDVLGRALPADATSSPVPTVIIVFGSARSFAPNRPRFEGRAIEAAGFFQSGEDTNFIVVNGSTGEQALSTILHEYAHAVVSNRMGSLPAWLNEGLAEFYETFESRNGGRSALIGLAPAHRVQLLRDTTLIPLRDLFAITSSSSDYNEGRRRGVFYAQSWALWHYLYFAGEPRASQLNGYVLEAPSAASQEAAVRAAFGEDLQSLEAELRRYVTQVSFKAMTFAFDEKVLGSQVGPILRIDEPEATAFLGDLLGRARREDEARKMLLPLLQDPRGGARARAALGLLVAAGSRRRGACPARACRRSLPAGPHRAGGLGKNLDCPPVGIRCRLQSQAGHVEYSQGCAHARNRGMRAVAVARPRVGDLSSVGDGYVQHFNAWRSGCRRALARRLHSSSHTWRGWRDSTLERFPVVRSGRLQPAFLGPPEGGHYVQPENAVALA